MTDPKPTTNEQIALELGWTYMAHDAGLWFNEEQGIYLYDPPDYEHSWAQAGPLLEELVNARYWTMDISSASWPGVVPADRKGWVLCMRGRDEIIYNLVGRGDTLTEAIAHAWLAWKKEGK